MRKVLEKKSHSLRLPTPIHTALPPPSLQQEAMMASAESGRGAILSTHKHGQQLRELGHSVERNKKPAPASRSS